MQRRTSIAELRRAGISLLPHEAVAITQELIQTFRSAAFLDEVHPPFGPPTAENVFLVADGQVACASCEAPLAVSELGIFLQMLLPDGASRVPGSLRYTVARALLDVEAPPFDSVDDFSEALARHERGNRREVVASLVLRAATAMRTATDAPLQVDRRRFSPDVAELRRELRNADARLFDQQQAIDALGTMAASTRRLPRPAALAAGFVAGLLLIGAGEWMHLRGGDEAVVANKPASEAAVSASSQQAAPVASPDDDARLTPVADVSVEPIEQVSAPPRREAASSGPRIKAAPARTPRPTAPPQVRARERKSPFSWLRTRIAFRSDPL